MSFHEIRFPVAISLGSSGGPERRTDIVTLSNGFEERNAIWAHSRRRYDAGIGLSSLDDLEEATAFFEARMGRLYGFRWKDWADFKSCLPSQEVYQQDQHLGFGDGVTQTFQLRKAYTSGANTYWRPIKKPVVGTVLLSVAGELRTEGVDYFVDDVTGVVTLQNAPSEAEDVSAGFEFDVPVRFELDQIETSVTSFSAGQIPSIPVVEVRV